MENVVVYPFPTKQEAEVAAVRVHNFLNVVAVVLTQLPGEAEFLLAFDGRHEERVRNFLKGGE